MKEEPNEETADQPPKKSKGAGESDNYIVPEEYQQKVKDVIHQQPKHHIAHVRGMLNNREDEIRKEEMDKKPKTFSKDEMPISNY